MPIKHTDNEEYFSKAEIEEIVKGRVKASNESAAAWEQKYKAAEPELAKVSTLAAERDQWKGKAETAEGGFKRYQAAASHGITDPDTIWAIEQAHARTMAGTEESKRVDFGGYLSQIAANPNLAPSFLRPVLSARGQGAPGGKGGGQDAGPTATAGGAGGGGGGAPTERPAWAPAVSGQQPVQAGHTPDFGTRIAQAKTLDDVAKLSAERRRR